MQVLIFDGSPVALNDSVWDTAFGSGNIVEIQVAQNKFRVRFGQRVLQYDLTGQGIYPRKTLFWREPIGGFYPRKNDITWATFANLRNAIAHALDIQGAQQ